jgi:hypothetical protein
VELVQADEKVTLEFSPGSELKEASTQRVTTALLGNAKIPKLPYENADGSPLEISTDYFGKNRSQSQPTPGPFERPAAGQLRLK